MIETGFVIGIKQSCNKIFNINLNTLHSYSTHTETYITVKPYNVKILNKGYHKVVQGIKANFKQCTVFRIPYLFFWHFNSFFTPPKFKCWSRLSQKQCRFTNKFVIYKHRPVHSITLWRITDLYIFFGTGYWRSVDSGLLGPYKKKSLRIFMF